MSAIRFSPESRKALFSGFLQPGSIFYRPESTFHSQEPHYFVVLNPAPKSDSVLVLTNAQTDIEKRLALCKARRLSESTIVVLTPDELACLRHDSVFDCNFPIRKSIDELAEEYAIGGLRFETATATEEILIRLRQGIIDSKIAPDPIREAAKLWLY